MLDSSQGSDRVVATPITRPLEAVRQSRGFAGPVIAFGVIVAALYYGRVFFITALIAVVIAFILEPFVSVLMRVHVPRGLASFLVCKIGRAHV